MQREVEAWWCKCRSGYPCRALAYPLSSQHRVGKANQMEWPSVPASGQRQRQLIGEGRKAAGHGRCSQGNDAFRNHPFASRRLCLPCLKPDSTRTYQTTQTTCPGANLTASSTCQWAGVRLAVLKRGDPEAEARADLPPVALLVLPLSDDNNKDNMSTASSSVTALFVPFVHRHVASFCCQGTGVESWQTVGFEARSVVGRVARSAKGLRLSCPVYDEPLALPATFCPVSLPCLFAMSKEPVSPSHSPCRCCLSSRGDVLAKRLVMMSVLLEGLLLL